MGAPIRLTISVSVLALASHAGVMITQVVQELYGEGHLDTNIIRIENAKMRVEAYHEQDSSYQIYRGDSALLWTVIPKDKVYFQRTGKEAEAMRAKWIEGIARIRAEMEKLPPERRAEMQGQLAKMTAGARTTYRKTGDGGKVSGWPTVKYEGFRKDEKIAEAWVTNAENLGMRESDARAIRDMDGYFDKYSSGWPGKETEGNGKVGVTVKTVAFRDGKPMWRTEYVAVRQENCEARIFDLPPGLTLKIP